jgi:hypothetical protein
VISTSGLAATGGGITTKDNGGVFISDAPGASITDSSQVVGRSCPNGNQYGIGGNTECAAGEISYRSQAILRKITAINGSQYTIDPPLDLTNWRTSQHPGVWWTGPSATWDGIENLTFDMTADTNAGDTGIVFVNSYDGWVKNVRGVNGGRNHVWINHSARVNVQDSYFFGTKGGATESYGVETMTASDDLVHNNICQHVVACIVNGQDYGSVFAYNYAFDDGTVGTTWLMALLAGDHDFAAVDLFEGNDTNVMDIDDGHGTGTTITSFRNRLAGQGVPTKTNTASLRAVTDNAFMRANNFVGNILGTVGAQTTYVYTDNFAPTIYNLNFNNVTTNDPLLSSSLLRWGNYDVVTGAVRWCGNSSDPGWSTICNGTSEIPTTGVPFLNGNPVPANTNLPASFYLSSQPSFWTTPWGTPPWPAIGPDITATGALNATCSGNPNACDGVGNYSYQIPAQICYNNTSVDPAYQQTFTITNAVYSGAPNYLTFTIGTNSLATPETVMISGVNPSSYNGIYQIYSSTSTTITVTTPNNPGTYISGGTLNWPNIILFNAANCYPNAYGGTPGPPTNLNAVAQ